MKTELITVSPDVMSGTPVFAGTRVPLQTLIDHLEGGQTIDDFLEGFPTVKREQVVAFLEEAKERIVAAATRDEVVVRDVERQVVEALYNQGLIGNTGQPANTLLPFTPLSIEGPPLSHTVIEERR